MSQGDLVNAVGRRGVRLSISSLSRLETGRRLATPALLGVLEAVLGKLEGFEEPLEAPPADPGAEPAYAVAVGHRIKLARRAAGLTQGELAAKVVDLGEVSADSSILSRYETGNVLPGLQRIAAIAEVLDVPVDLLLNGNPADGGEVELVRAYRSGGLPGVLQWVTSRLTK